MYITKLGEVNEKPLIGMLHLGGADPVEQAMEELKIFQGEGLDGVIVEDYASDGPRFYRSPSVHNDISGVSTVVRAATRACSSTLASEED